MVFPVEFLARFAIPLTIASFFIGDIPGQIQIYDKVLNFADKTLSQANREGEVTENFDYIIVGAGAAGAVVANRLSASGENRVLLLEAGGDPNPVSDLPFVQPYLINSPMDYNYSTVKQEKACLFYNDGMCNWERGKALGGSTSINGLLYNRCNPKDYDNWANFTGDPIWKFESVVDAFKTIEDYHGFFENNPGPNHGTGGEIYVGKISYLPSLEFFYHAVAEKGIPWGDLNSGQFPYGFSEIDYNIKDGLRWGTYQGFLEPILNRPNLVIYRYAYATKVHLDASKRATGVTYQRHGVSRFAAANKEVIISGGVVESPKLLMLSGIGPREHLEQHGIETLVDLPAVGQHMQDHPGVEISPFYINKTFGRPELTPENVNQFISNQTGPLTSFLYGYGTDNTAPQLAMGYLTSSLYNDRSWPDLHYYIHEQLINTNTPNEVDSVFFSVELARTDTVGSIRLASSNPEDHPIIDPNFFSDPTDLDRMVDGVEQLMDIFLNTSVYQSLGIRLSDTVHPISQCPDLGFPSREYWKCFISFMSLSYNHPTSTCRMGPNNSVAVVDSKLRVFGTTGLRVIDSSIMPFCPNGNTMFPAIMVGEMGSRIILNSIH